MWCARAGPYRDANDRPLASGAPACRGPNARVLSRRSHGLRRRAWSAPVRASINVGGRNAGSGSAGRRRLQRIRPSPTTRTPRCTAHHVADADVDELMSRRATTFYYSFLALPQEKRRAIVAVWDFCRAVDDAVDESTDGMAASSLAA